MSEIKKLDMEQLETVTGGAPGWGKAWGEGSRLWSEKDDPEQAGKAKAAQSKRKTTPGVILRA